MNKKIIAVILVSTAAVTVMGKRRYNYVGIDNCKTCHSSRGGMTQYELWQTSPHAKAFRTLKNKKARKIASKSGITRPWENRTCLKCHTTGRGKINKTKTEGVGCESCHGPGSGYFRVEGHVDFRDRRRGYMKAKKKGMYPILDYEDNLIKREKLCRYCHNKKRPCRPVTKAEIERQRLTIQVIDTLKKGDMNFSHPIRRY